MTFYHNVKSKGKEMAKNYISALLLSVILAIVYGQDLQLTCYEEGECVEGVILGPQSADNYNECMKLCYENTNCAWVTYYKDIRLCYQYYDCTEISSQNCPYCHTGQHIKNRLYTENPTLYSGEIGSLNFMFSLREFLLSISSCYWDGSRNVYVVSSTIIN